MRGINPAAFHSASRFRPKDETRITPRVKTPKVVSWAPAARRNPDARAGHGRERRGYTRERGGRGRVRAQLHNHRRRDSFAAIGNRVNRARPIRATGRRAVQLQTRDRRASTKRPAHQSVAITVFDNIANDGPAWVEAPSE